MLFVTEITNPAKREAASDYLESHERCALVFAAQCAPDSLVKMGPVHRRGHGVTFEICAASGAMLVPFVVTIAAGMPESDVWSAWTMALECGGLRVRADATYEAWSFAELERLEA
jgi:hypothetical protein